MTEYFAILGLKPGASRDEIRLAFRRLARELHPDVASAYGLPPHEADRRFKEVRHAYELLMASVPMPHGVRPATVPQSGRGPAPAPSRNPAPAPGGEEPGPWRRAAPYEKRAARGEDFELGLAVTLEEVLRGATRQIGYRLNPQLPARQVQVNIPAGVRPDQVLRIPKEGHPGRHLGRPGDLLLRIRYSPHSMFGVRENNLLADLAIHPALAVIGGVFAIPLLGGGETQLQVPAGVQAGQQYRIHGEGLPQGGQSRGDLIITISIAVPTRYSMEERRLWEELARLAVQRDD